MGTASMDRIFVDQERLNNPGHLSRRQTSLQLSDLAEYDTLFPLNPLALIAIQVPSLQYQP